MKQVSISYKIRTNLIEQLEKQDNINTLEDRSFLKKMTFSKKEYPDVYFHVGEINEKIVDILKNTKKIIVNSLHSKSELVNSLKIDDEKIEVIYPSVDIEFIKPKLAKKKICEDLNIDPKKKIILFTGKNLKTSGVKEFIEIIFSLNVQKYIAIIAGDAKQMYNLRFSLSKFDYSDKLLLLEDYQNMDELFLASDIFLFPTHSKTFSLNVLKAMYCKCAVFLPISNHGKELIDVFSTMDSPMDRSAPFKVDALLLQKDELKKIKKENYKIASKFTLDKNLSKVNDIIKSI